MALAQHPSKWARPSPTIRVGGLGLLDDRVAHGLRVSLDPLALLVGGDERVAGASSYVGDADVGVELGQVLRIAR